MNNNDQLPKMTFENLKKIEADVFSGRSRAEKHKSGGDGQVRDTWRLNQEVLDARREAAALKEELNAARTLIAEQNVFAVSSRSALREMQQAQVRDQSGENAQCRLEGKTGAGGRPPAGPGGTAARIGEGGGSAAAGN